MTTKQKPSEKPIEHQEVSRERLQGGAVRIVCACRTPVCYPPPGADEGAEELMRQHVESGR